MDQGTELAPWHTRPRATMAAAADVRLAAALLAESHGSSAPPSSLPASASASSARGPQLLQVLESRFLREIVQASVEQAAASSEALAARRRRR